VRERLRAAACLAMTKANKAAAAPLRAWNQIMALEMDDVQAA